MRLKLYRNCVLISILFAVISLSVSGGMPKTYKITGMVLNKETNDPIPLVEVFISGSTYGSITNEEGKFELETSYLPCQLIASHISYAPFNKSVEADSRTDLTLRMIPYQHEIKEITVESMSRRKDNMELFKRGFLGWDDIAGTCTILNDSVLSFTWDSLVFSASAYQPVLIDNPKLGYRIKIILKNFKLIYKPKDYKRIHKGRKIKPDVTDAIYHIACNFHYSPYPQGTKREQERIEKTRLRVFYGSKMHFLRALYSDQLKAHGYEINPGIKSAPITYSQIMDSWSGIKIFFLDQEGYQEKLMIYPEEPMMISFYKDYTGKPIDLNRDSGDHLDPLQSMVKFANKKCIVRYNGSTLDYSLIFSGHIGDQRISNMLPDDFMPDDTFSQND
jgi:hypothetical protein